jgi:hypothetical protein
VVLVVKGSCCGLLENLHIRLFNVVVVNWYLVVVVGFNIAFMIVVAFILGF